MIKILAIDPGVTTGFAYGEIDDGCLVFAADQAEFKCLGMWKSLIHMEPDELICETFEFRQGKQRGNLNLYSRNLIGVITLYHELYEIPLHMQTAAQGKGFFDNHKLKMENAYIVAKEHGRDAVRHLLYWFYFGAGFKYNEKGHKLAPMAFL